MLRPVADHHLRERCTYMQYDIRDCRPIECRHSTRELQVPIADCPCPFEGQISFIPMVGGEQPWIFLAAADDD